MSARRPTPDARTFDRRQFRALLGVYFKINVRGSISRGLGPQGKPRAFIWTFAIYALMGLMIGGGNAFLVPDMATYLTIVYSVTFMMAMMIAILESSNILFSPQEEDVLGHRPVSERTLLAAKIVNLVGILLAVALSLNAASLFFILRVRGARPWAPLAHLAVLVLLCVFCASAVVLIYGVVTRWVGRERFQALVTWAQIVMMILFTVGFQFAGRFADGLKGFDVRGWLPWLLPLPPMWFVGLGMALGSAAAPGMMFLLGGVALGATGVCAWLALARLADLQGRISESLMERPAVAARERPLTAAPPRPMNPLLALWLRDPVERGVFRLISTYLRRDRHTMQQVYPHLAFVLVYPLIIVFSGSRTHQDGGTYILLLGAVMLGMIPVTLLEMLRTTDRPEPSELFAIVPLEGAGRLFHGVRKAILACLLLPATLVFVLIAVLFLHVTPHDLVGVLPVFLMLPTFSLFPGTGARPYIPFSVQGRGGHSAGRVAASLFSMLILGLVSGLSAAATYFGMLHWLLLAEAPVVLLVHRLMLRDIAAPRPIRVE